MLRTEAATRWKKAVVLNTEAAFRNVKAAFLKLKAVFRNVEAVFRKVVVDGQNTFIGTFGLFLSKIFKKKV